MDYQVYQDSVFGDYRDEYVVDDSTPTETYNVYNSTYAARIGEDAADSDIRECHTPRSSSPAIQQAAAAASSTVYECPITIQMDDDHPNYRPINDYVLRNRRNDEKAKKKKKIHLSKWFSRMKASKALMCFGSGSRTSKRKSHRKSFSFPEHDEGPLYEFVSARPVRPPIPKPRQARKTSVGSYDYATHWYTANKEKSLLSDEEMKKTELSVTAANQTGPEHLVVQQSAAITSSYKLSDDPSSDLLPTVTTVPVQCSIDVVEDEHVQERAEPSHTDHISTDYRYRDFGELQPRRRSYISPGDISVEAEYLRYTTYRPGVHSPIEGPCSSGYYTYEPTPTVDTSQNNQIMSPSAATVATAATSPTAITPTSTAITTTDYTYGNIERLPDTTDNTVATPGTTTATTVLATVDAMLSTENLIDISTSTTADTTITTDNSTANTATTTADTWLIHFETNEPLANTATGPTDDVLAYIDVTKTIDAGDYTGPVADVEGEGRASSSKSSGAVSENCSDPRHNFMRSLQATDVSGGLRSDRSSQLEQLVGGNTQSQVEGAAGVENVGASRRRERPTSSATLFSLSSGDITNYVAVCRESSDYIRKRRQSADEYISESEKREIRRQLSLLPRAHSETSMYEQVCIMREVSIAKPGKLESIISGRRRRDKEASSGVRKRIEIETRRLQTADSPIQQLTPRPRGGTNKTPAVSDRERINRDPFVKAGTGPSPAQFTRQTTGEDTDQLVDDLSKKGSKEGYHPVPENIKRFIAGVAKERGVGCGAIYQSPEDPKELQIIGINASSMSDVVTETIEQFHGFTFSVIDSADPRHLIEQGGNGIFGVKKQIIMRGRDQATNRLGMIKCDDGENLCGLILTGRTVARHPIDAYYVVVPAHLVLGDLCESLADGTKTIEEMRKEIQGTADKTLYTLDLHNSNDENDIQPMPMFAYRHFWSDEGANETTHEFTNDIALLKIEPHQLCGMPASQPGIKLSQIELAMRERKDFQWSKAKFKEHITTLDDIFPLKYPHTLQKMASLGVYVVIGPAKGYMVPCGELISSDGRNWTLAIEFVLLDWKFRKGDCGLVAYVQDTREPYNLYPFGMLIGKSLRKPKCGKDIYRAIVLRQALDEIEFDYQHLVSILRPIGRAHKCYADGDDIVADLNQNPDLISPSLCGNSRSTSCRFRTTTDDTGLGDSIPETESSIALDS